MPSEAELRRAVLDELRIMSRQQARTGSILTYDVADATQRHGVGADDVADVLSDLRIEGLIEEYAAGLNETVVTGHCRITAEGLRYLRGE
jgi:hypothetical protein